ncbi:MAG: hypothetical protein IJG24_01270, partial [Selenomonadaceae bacterium]|nr:hypothetical protein [Selenomonadaceae bacterium]
RVLSVYLTNYDDSTKTEQLRQQLLSSVRNVDSVSLKKTFAARDNLFGDRRFDNMTKLFAQRLSVEGSLASIGLSNFYKASNFIQAALKIFFRTNMPPATQFKLLEELDADYNAYRNIFPAVADALIQTVNRSGFGKEQCIETFYKRLDDPRFGYGRIKWKEVSPKSKDIFSHWLSAEDLEIFFEIVNATAQDKQWKYREKFWRAYLPRIVKTKIFLGYDAKRLAAQIKGKVDLKNGDLKGATANQSVFVFQIGRYIFSEWSHNGSYAFTRSRRRLIFSTRRKTSSRRGQSAAMFSLKILSPNGFTQARKLILGKATLAGGLGKSAALTRQKKIGGFERDMAGDFNGIFLPTGELIGGNRIKVRNAKPGRLRAGCRRRHIDSVRKVGRADGRGRRAFALAATQPLSSFDSDGRLYREGL